MTLPKLAIVGRPNVGKSSLFNWLAGRRIAIVDDTEGVTRDRVSTLIQLGEGDDAPYCEIIDTGGIGIIDRDDLSEQVEGQIETAIQEADLVLFVVDCRAGRLPLDEEVAARLRYVDRPVILVLNKADDPRDDDRGADFTKLGRGKPIYVSVMHNRNKHGLQKLIRERLPDLAHAKPGEEVMKIAVVGRPNTGKSTFVNILAQAERMIVSERPGTTRDSVDVHFELDGLPFVAIDTAGVRRKAKVRDDLDYYSIHRAERSIRRADIVLLFIDANEGVTRLDKQLADYVTKQHKPCVIVINKWDLMAADTGSSPEMMNKYAFSVQHAFRTMPYAPLAFITAKTGKNVKALLNLCQAMYKQYSRRVGTGVLNRVVSEAVAAHPPSPRENRQPRVYYATQVGTRPPTVVVFVNSPSLFDPTYQRYLLGVFREKLPFRDIPIKLYLRARSQSEPGAGASGHPASESGGRSSRAHSALQDPDLDREINELLSELDN
jgi:GTP-binding protein